MSFVEGVFSLILCMGIFWQCSFSQTGPEALDNSSLRLPSSVRPSHYVVRLRPYFENNFNVDGYVAITFNVFQRTDHFSLHMKDISPDKSTLQVISSGGSLMTILNQTYDSKREFYNIHLADQLLNRRRYTLHLNFSGVLSDDLEGFYKMSFNNEAGHKIWAGATQFQATSARRAFPCFDEPDLKATFKVFLGRRENMTALSNMPLKDVQPIEPGWVYDEFETTVPMSTYLLAFVICNFAYIEGQSQELTTNLKVWSRKSLIEQANYGRDIAEKGLLLMEDYFKLKFPLPKLDLVAVPEMSPSAMENWGLIISRESGLLHIPGEGSDEKMRHVTYLICHELAHQWFGNIVTMRWWTDLWLNEGFATYIGYFVTDLIKPEWRVMDHFVVKSLQKVMKLDALKSAPPVRVPVEDPQDIREIFGEIAYLKGASIIRMMNNFLGEETLRNGLSMYLNELKYKSSEQDDLWRHLTMAAHEINVLPSDLSVKYIMETWTSQPGFPVIQVSRENGSVTLKQSPFKLAQSNETDESDDLRLWFVPITYVTETKPEFTDKDNNVWWLRKDDAALNLRLPGLPNDKWILFNPKKTGYYRVNYDTLTWNQLIRQLQKNHSLINVVSRAQLLDDSLSLAQAGLLDYDTAMSVTSYLPQESDYIPWMAALNNFGYLNIMLRSTRVYGAFKDYVLSVITPLLESLGLDEKESDTVSERLLREGATMWACHMGHEDCVQTAENLVEQWRENPLEPSPVQRNLAKTFYCAAVREGGEETWNFLWSKYQDQDEDPGHRQIILNALGCSKEVWILARYLETSLKSEFGISRQDASLVYLAMIKSPIGSLLAWNHLKENWIRVKDYIGTSMFALPNLMKAIVAHFNTIQYRDEILWFKEKYEGNFGPAKLSVEQALELTQANIVWLSSNLETIESWLRVRGFKSSLRKQ